MAIKLDNNENEIIADINVTPLIDIMLVLLIIFMVTSSISFNQGMDVELPKVSSQTGKSDFSAIIISVDKRGEISVQGKPSSLDDLKVDIEETMKKEDTKFVVLNGDREINLGLSVEIMDIAKLAGADQFAIATQED